VNWNLIASYDSQTAAAKALGVTLRIIDRYVKSLKLYHGMYFRLGPKVK